MKLSANGIKKLCLWESKGGKPELVAYQDRGGKWTFGYGFTDGVHEGDTITEDAANLRLGTELIEYEAAVTKACIGPTTQNQFDAMVILAWNIGIPRFLKSSVIKAHNRGDFASAARAFGLWNKVTVDGVLVVDKGLVNRRAKEVALYTEPVASAEPVPVPQLVASPKTMGASTINRAGVVAGGTAAVATVSETIRTVADVKDSVSSLGDWLIPILLVITLCAVGYIVWERFQQRNRGQA